ncbi:hypothetical protein [Actinoplanes sp. NPDC023714]|uniref:hypothetical protein n=1 Tax=Actinoplanes sp. NPDC023714 TaxID=3154322 RepID=UPI0033F85B86
MNAVEGKLARRTHGVLGDSIWPTEIAGLAFTTVEDGFVSPDFRLAPSPLPADAGLASEDWWRDEAPVHRDLAGFLTRYLTLARDRASREPLGSILLEKSSRLHDDPRLKALSELTWESDDVGSARSAPEMVREFAGKHVSDDLVAELLDTLTDYEYLAWDSVEPSDLIRLIDGRPDMDQAVLAKAVASYLEHRGTPPTERAELLRYVGE